MLRRKGYVEQQWERMGTMLAALLGLRQKGDAEQTREAIRAGAKELTGLDLDLLATVPEPGLLALFASGDGKVDAPMAAGAGVFLGEMAGHLSEQGLSGNPEVQQMRGRSLLLLCIALAQEEGLRKPDLITRAMRALAAVPAAEQTEATRRAVASFYFAVKGAGKGREENG